MLPTWQYVDPQTVYPEWRNGELYEVRVMAEKWIQKAIDPAKRGSLRKTLGAKPGQPIPAKKLAAAAKKGGVTGQRARLAQTLKKLNG